MSLAASCLSLALMVSATSGTVAEEPRAAVAAIDLSAPAITGLAQVLPKTMVAPPAQPGLDRQFRSAAGRPAALPVMYAGFGALQVLDVYSTRRAISSGAVEANPIMKGFAGNAGAMLAVKSAAAAASIFCAEKAWKRNRKAAIVLMAALNGATAVVVGHNLRQAR